MDVSKITLQLLNLEIAECKKQDLQKKFNIAVNIVKKSEYNPMRIENVGDVADLTGVPSEVLEKLKELEESKVTFEDWSREQQIDCSEVHKIRKFIVKRFMSQGEIANRKLLEILLKRKQMKGEVIQIYLNKFFTYIQLPGTDGNAIIVEKPETVRKRYDYLESKLKYHNEDRHIVYLGGTRIRHGSTRKRGIEISGNALGHGALYIMAVSAKTGYIDSTFYSDVHWNSVKIWLINRVFSVLPPGTVVVFSDKLYVEDKPPPTSTASRKAMSDWLQSQDIPHDPESHKAELYFLIEKYKKPHHFEASKVKDYLAGTGHTLLLRPKLVEYGYFDDFWKQLQTIEFSVKYYHEQISSIAKDFDVNYWKNLEVTLIERELEEYKGDWNMEVVLDKLLNFTKHKGLPRKDNIDLDTYPKHVDKEYIFLP